MPRKRSDPDLLREYRETLSSWGEAQEGMESRRQVQKANRLHDKQQRLYNALRQTEEGRNGIMHLMLDPDPWVRVIAATKSLQWDTPQAKAVLSRLADDHRLPPALLISAEMAIELWDNGELDVNY